MTAVPLQPGSVAFGLDIAGMWAEAARRALPDARLATNDMQPPDRWRYQSQAASAVLSTHLALEHTLTIVRRASWFETPPPMPEAVLAELHDRTGRFRDAFMHLEEKAARPQTAKLAAGSAAWPPGAPAGYIALGLYFEGGGAGIYAVVGLTETAALTRISWDELDEASEAIYRWALDLVSRWNEAEGRWAERVRAINEAAGFR